MGLKMPELCECVTTTPSAMFLLKRMNMYELSSEQGTVRTRPMYVYLVLEMQYAESKPMLMPKRWTSLLEVIKVGKSRSYLNGMT